MWEPPNQFRPQKGPEAYPDTTQQPTSGIRATIDASLNWYAQNATAAQLVGEIIVDFYSANMSQFINTCRHNYSLSTAEQDRRQLALPGFELDWSMNQGIEHIDVVVHPESFNHQNLLPKVDLNYDGYIVWLHDEPYFPNIIDNKPTSAGPYDIYVNGVQVLQGFKPTIQFGGAVIMFGQTALRCQSLCDADDGLSSNNPLFQKINGGLVNRDLPPLTPDIAVMTAPDGLTLSSHKDLPGYFVFEWNQTINQATLVTENDGISYIRFSSFDSTAGTPQLQKGIQFFNSSKSPLVPNGPNFVTVIPSPAAAIPEILMIDILYAEFFKRDKIRVVSQSANLDPDPQNDLNIATLDTPYAFCASFPGTGTFGVSMGFDLTPKVYDSADDNFVDWNGGPTYGGTNLALTQAMIEARNAYNATIAADVTAFQNSRTGLIHDDSIAYENQLTAFDDILNSMYSILGTLDEGPPQDLISPFYTIWEGIPGSPSYVAADDTIAGYYAQLGPVNGPALKNLEKEGAAQIIVTGDALDKLINDATAYPPDLPAPPSAISLPNNYEFRDVTITGNIWEFGPWQNK